MENETLKKDLNELQNLFLDLVEENKRLSKACTKNSDYITEMRNDVTETRAVIMSVAELAKSANKQHTMIAMALDAITSKIQYIEKRL